MRVVVLRATWDRERWFVQLVAYEINDGYPELIAGDTGDTLKHLLVLLFLLLLSLQIHHHGLTKRI